MIYEQGSSQKLHCLPSRQPAVSSSHFSPPGAFVLSVKDIQVLHASQPDSATTSIFSNTLEQPSAHDHASACLSAIDCTAQGLHSFLSCGYGTLTRTYCRSCLLTINLTSVKKVPRHVRKRLFYLYIWRPRVLRLHHFQPSNLMAIGVFILLRWHIASIVSIWLSAIKQSHTVEANKN